MEYIQSVEVKRLLNLPESVNKLIESANKILVGEDDKYIRVVK
jgi:hypothetical protein